MNLLSWPAALGITLAFLVVAAMARRWASRARDRVKSIALFLTAYWLGFAGSSLAAAMGWLEVARVTGNVASFVGWGALIFLAALTLFRLILPRLGFELPSIAADLTIGASLFALVIVSLRVVGVDPTSLVATSAVVTGILALSLQPTLGNVIGGVALQMDRSVRVGDWLELDNGKQGCVREIRWRHTVIETRDWDTIIVPNSNLLQANILILGKREGQPVQHRSWVQFNVDFRYRPTEVIRVVQEALRSPPQLTGVATTPPPDCVCMDLASDERESYGLYAARYWLNELANDDPTASRVRQRVYAALQRAGIPLAIPAAQLFLDQDTAERREQKRERQLKRQMAALRSIEFLSVLTPEELISVGGSLRAAPFAASETITRQGAAAHWLYVLVEGEAEVRVSEGGHEKKVATLTAPTFFGEMGLMTGEPRTATVIATTPVLCYKLDRYDFEKILKQRPQIAEGISNILATRQVELESARKDLDEAAKSSVQATSRRLLTKIRDFFGLTPD